VFAACFKILMITNFRENNDMKKSTVSVIIGSLVVAGGIFFGGQALGYWEEYNVSFDGWWTLFIIIPCVISIFQQRF